MKEHVERIVAIHFPDQTPGFLIGKTICFTTEAPKQQPEELAMV